MRKLLLALISISVFLSCVDNSSKNQNRSKSLQTIEFNSLSDTRAYFNWNSSAKKLVSAHRGGSYKGYPENCIETFEYVLKSSPAIIECDIAKSKDGVLVMMHDDKIDRTTNGQGYIKDYTLDQLKAFNLVDLNGIPTSYKVPTLENVLNWTKGKAFLTLDVKKGVSYEAVNHLIQKTKSQAYVAIIAYSIEAAKKIYAINPNLMISIPGRNMEDVQRIKDSKINTQNLIAFTGVSEPQKEVYDALHQMNIYCILGTLGNLDKKAIARGDHIYNNFLKNGADILATDRPLEVAKEILK